LAASLIVGQGLPVGTYRKKPILLIRKTPIFLKSLKFNYSPQVISAAN
jgi:hypothetical protein